MARLWRTGMRSVSKILVGVLLASFSLVAAAREVAVVGGKTDNLQAVSVQDLTKICSGKLLKWPDGRDVKVFVSEPTVEILAEKLLKVPVQELRSTLKKTPGIVILGTDREVIANVQKAPGSIGLMDIYSITSAVSVMRVEGKLPFDPGYVLHRSQ